MFRVNITDPVTPRMKRKSNRRLELMQWMRQGAENLVRYLRGFYDRKDQAEPNYFVREMMGVRRTHFWKQVGDSVADPIVKRDGVSVAINHPHINQKIHGGPILPVRARALTIPVHPEAYGRTAAQVESALGIDLFIKKTALGDAFLMGKVKQGRRTHLWRFFLLRAFVNQDPWPNSIPDKVAMREAFFRGVRKAIMGD
jgi:hypothetical protein